MTKPIIQSYKFRVYPSKAQITKLEDTLYLCRFLYNSALQERIGAYKEKQISLNYFSQQNQLPDIKKLLPEYNGVHSQVLQNVLKRLDLAFQSFFRRVQQGAKAGFPRFQNKHRYNSFTFAQGGFSISDSKLSLSKIGKVKIKQHRLMVGKVKTLTISRDTCGKWFACFVVETTQELLKPTNKSVGIDMGLTVFATLSDGCKINNPRFLKRDEKILATAQRRLSIQVKGTKERHKKRQIVAKIHNRIKNRRSDFAHQTSRLLVNNYDQIFFENLQIKEMMQNGDYAKGISDVAWKQTIQLATYKAEKAGRIVGMVNPAYTSQTCSGCGHSEKANRVSQSKFVCRSCNLHINADFNASLNILSVGLNTFGNQSVEAPFITVSV